MRNRSSRSTHVAEAMTTRPVARSTAITDQVANADVGRVSRTARARSARFMARHLTLRCPMQIRAGLVLVALVLAPAVAGAQTPTFSKDVAPIFYAKCVECHRASMF